jgi:hypothetical protein
VLLTCRGRCCAGIWSEAWSGECGCLGIVGLFIGLLTDLFIGLLTGLFYELQPHLWV